MLLKKEILQLCIDNKLTVYSWKKCLKIVDHTPTLLYKDASQSISSEVINFINCFIEEKENIVLNMAKIIENGISLDKEIIDYQRR